MALLAGHGFWRCLTALYVIASAIALTTVAAVENFEIDIIFPRNETYKSAEVFPIVLGVKNATSMSALGNFTLRWGIMEYTEGWTPTGLDSDSGEIAVPRDTDDSVVLVAMSNVTYWSWQKRYRANRYLFSWAVLWDDVRSRCEFENSNGRGEVMFNIAPAWEQETGPSDWERAGSTDPADMKEAEVPLGCPTKRTSVDVTPSVRLPDPSTPTWTTYAEPLTALVCPYVDSREQTHDDTSAGCAVTVDAAMASSISSHATGLAEASMSATMEPTRSSSSSTGAAPTGRPVQTALAAACFLGGVLLPACA